MRFCGLFLLFISFSSLSSTSKFECKYLDYNLALQTSGVEHIVHELKINGKITIIELLKGGWFIEEVNCNKTGYEIVASHIQYNDSNKTVFMLTYSGISGYKITVNKQQTNNQY
jgi:hypothetical protein